MCGITGYIGSSPETVLLKMLKRLEYRGYDSSGVAIKNGKITISRACGRIQELEKVLVPVEGGKLGIAHTRWATHGKVTVQNAHPQVSTSKKWAVVHNGIIENFSELKIKLHYNGINLVSGTDTEVIPQLLALSKKDGIAALLDVVPQLSGSYALLCLDESEDKLFLAKNKSPIYLAENGQNVYVASDPACFYGYAEEYYSLNDGELCAAASGDIKFYTSKGKLIEKETEVLSGVDEENGTGIYPHYMLKEINEIPKVLRHVVEAYADDAYISKISDIIEDINRIKIVGCGTAYHSGLVGADFLERHLGIETTAHIASEFRYCNPIVNENTLCIFVSQSGETADTLAALDTAKDKGATTVAITNVAYSTIAQKADIVLPICAGAEIAVASTKAYVAQLAVFYILARKLAKALYNTPETALKDLNKLSREKLLLDKSLLDDIIDFFDNSSDAFFIGRGLDYYTSAEASLKLKEITYVNSNAYAAGELKHGVLALIENDTPVVVSATQQSLLAKTLSNAKEVEARGGKIIVLSQFDIPADYTKNAFQIKLRSLDEDLMSIVAIVPMQQISYYLAVKKGNNPDKPRNLAKSVTVE